MSDVSRTHVATTKPYNVAAGLGPMAAIVFLGFLAVGAPLPALAIYVHGRLGFSPFVVGAVVGAQSIATILTRDAAGAFADRHGPRRAVLLGLPLASASGLFYFASAAMEASDGAKLGVFLAGRLLMGLGESLFVTGAMSWGIARLGPSRTGVVMSWQGVALYGALGVGAPLGLAAQSAFGFAGAAAIAVVAPLIACAFAFATPAAPASGGRRTPIYRVVGLIWRPGLVLMLATVPFAAMATFLALDYSERGWSGAGLALAGFAAGYILVRLVGSHWSDRFGGTKIATVSLLIEVVGQAVLWLAPGPGAAAAGAALTGVGFSLVFPAMGVEATRRVRPDQRGQAVGNFIAFFDAALGLTGPLVGRFAQGGGAATPFLIGAISAALALALLPAVRRMKASAELVDARV